MKPVHVNISWKGKQISIEENKTASKLLYPNEC